MIRTMMIEDYEQVYALWKKIHGFGLRSIDDSRDGVEKFLKRNPTTSVVATEDGKIVGGSCAAMMEDEAVCITSVWMKRIADRNWESNGRTVHGSFKRRRNQQCISDRIYAERYRKCILEYHRME